MDKQTTITTAILLISLIIMKAVDIINLPWPIVLSPIFVGIVTVIYLRFVKW